MPNADEEPKLIIDEDWKTQVQREREELKQKQEAEQTQADLQEPSKLTEESQVTANSAEDGNGEPPPPASFTLLVTTLATQAMAAMGLMPGAEGESPPVNLDFAKHFVDMLSVLEEKSKGNLTDAERSYLQDALHQLRMAFVAVSKQAIK